MSSAAASHRAYADSQSHQQHGPPPGQTSAINFHHEDGDDDDEGDDDDAPVKKPNDKKAGRRKIKIEFITDKSRRHITFSKRKAGIMKKAYELSTLTGTQVLLLVVSETGLVYTFTTAKLQPLVTQPEGKNLIQACLNSPPGQIPTGAPMGVAGSSVHQAAIHPPPPHPMSMPPPPQPSMPQQRNVPGGLSIDEPDRGRDDDDGDEDDDLPPGGASDDGTPPPSSSIPPGPQRHTSHHGAPGQSRPTAGSVHSAHGVHHSSHPYGGGSGGSAREAHHAHRRGASATKVTSPRSGMQTRAVSNLSIDTSGDGGLASPTLSQPHSAHPHDNSMYFSGGEPSPDASQQRMMGYPSGQPQQYSQGWSNVPPRSQSGHR